jgi:hypothetical protein
MSCPKVLRKENDVPKFRKKPVVIDAVQFTREIIEAHVFDNGPLPDGVIAQRLEYHTGDRKLWSHTFIIKTLEGQHVVSEGDWVITGVKGERYPCKPDVFAMTYEECDQYSNPIAIGSALSESEGKDG